MSIPPIDIINTAESISTLTYSLTSRSHEEMVKLLEKIYRVDTIDQKIDELIKDESKVNPSEILWIDGSGTHHNIENVPQHPQIELFQEFNGQAVEVYIGANVLDLPDSAFVLYNNNEPTSNTVLKKIYGTTIRTIGENCFLKCTALNTVEFPNVQIVNDNAFKETNIDQVSFPLAITFGDYIFKDNIRLEYVYAPNAINMGEGTFYNCTNLKKVEIYKLMEISDYMFYNCNLLSDVNFPAVTSIDKYAFSNCYSLTSAILPAVVTIKCCAFSDCTSLQYIYTPTLQNLPDEQLENESVTLQNKAFYNTSLKNAYFPNLTRIGGLTFQNCKRLETIYIPNVEYLGSNCFNGCLALKEITFVDKISNTIPACTLATFENTDPNQYVIIVPDSLYQTWKENWLAILSTLNIINASGSRTLRKDEIDDIIRHYIETHIISANSNSID